MSLANKIVLLIFFCILFTACSDTKILNEIKLVQTIGVDAIGKNVKSTVLVGSYKKMGESQVQLLDTESISNYDIMTRLNAQTRDSIEYGQLAMILFGKDYARKGIAEILKNLCKDAKISTMVQLGVADREASAILSVIEQSEESHFLSDMIKHNIKNGTLPRNNMQISLFNFYGEGRDLFLPHFTLNGGKITVDGLALFNSDKYITNINLKETFLLKLLIENTHNGTYLVPVKAPNPPKDRHVLLNSIKSKVKYSLNSIEPVPSINIRIQMEAQTKHVPDWIDSTGENKREKLETILEDYFEKRIQTLLSFCRKNKVDPAGIGDFVRSRSPQWDVQQFQAIYPQMKTNVTVKLKMIEAGIGI